MSNFHFGEYTLALGNIFFEAGTAYVTFRFTYRTESEVFPVFFADETPTHTEPTIPNITAHSQAPIAHNVTVSRTGGSDSHTLIQYSRVGLVGTEVRLYIFDGLNYLMFSSQTAEEDNVVFSISDPTILGRDTGVFFITLTETGMAESEKVMIFHSAVPVSNAVSYVAFNPNNVNEITVYGLEPSDTIRVYADANLTALIALTNSTGIQQMLHVPGINFGDTIFITRESALMDESLPFMLKIYGAATDVLFVPLAPSATVTGTVTSAGYSQTHTLMVDFAGESRAVVAMIRTGGASNVRFELSGDIIAPAVWGVPADLQRGSIFHKRWITINRPPGAQDVFTINVTVTTANWIDATSYNINAGPWSHANGNDGDIDLLGGRHNAVPASWYFSLNSTQWHATPSRGGNQQMGGYAPGASGYYFRFTYLPNTTFTMWTNHRDLRFRIVEVNNIGNEVVVIDGGDFAIDPNLLVDMTALTHIGNNQNVQKLRDEVASGFLVPGRVYYLVVYTLQGRHVPALPPTGLGSQQFGLAIGHPVTRMTSTRFNGVDIATSVNRSFSPTVFINVPEGALPNTAIVYSISLVSNPPPTFAQSDLQRWRVMNPDGGLNAWRLSAGRGLLMEFHPRINIMAGQVRPVGNWHFSFEGSRNAAISLRPGLNIRYFYELGD